MSDSDHEHENRLAARLFWAGVVILLLLGLALVALAGPTLLPFAKDDPPLTSLLQNIGYGLLGGAVTAMVFQFTSGAIATRQQERTERALSSLQMNIGKVPEIVSQATQVQQQAVAGQQQRILELSKMLATANSLGIVAVAGERIKTPVFGGRTFVERWQYLLEHAREVDLLCWEDSKLLSYDVWQGQAGIAEPVIARLRAGQLRLRILLSTRDNPALAMINKWIASNNYMQNQVDLAEDALRSSGVTTEFPAVLRRHRELLAFSLLRGDTELYVMYFFPKHGAGPIIQFAPSDILEAVAGGQQSSTNFYGSYTKYFDDLWGESDPAGRQEGRLANGAAQ